METTGDPTAEETPDLVDRTTDPHGAEAAATDVESDGPAPSIKAAEVRIEPPIGPDPQAAAFFDLDNTMIQGASLFYLARGLYKRDYFKTRTILRALWLQVVFRFIGGENPGHLAEIQAASLGFIEGRTVDEIRQVGEEIYEDLIAPRVWPGTRAIAQMHLDAGHQVWLVTATPVEMAATIASRLGVTGALGTQADTVDGVYTGRLEGGLLHGQAKATAVRELAERHGFDLARCYAYSDSHNDLPLLSLVGHPCAVNPDAKLLEYADQQDWQIRDYRTGRKAVKFGALSAGTLGATAVAVMAGLAIRRRLKG